MHLSELLADANTVGPYGTALIATVGALVGGAITAGSTVFVERQRRKHADQAIAAANNRELRQAGRIVLDELSEASRIVLDAARQGLEPFETPPLPVGAWVDNRVVLAGFLSDQAWQWGSMANRTIQEWNADRKAGYIIDLAGMRDRWATVRSAMEILESEIAVKTGATRAGIYQYTGYASSEEVWPEGGKPRGS